MNAKRCDRCGKFFVEGYRGKYKLIVHLCNIVDLCDDCMNDLEEWMNEKKEVKNDN